MGDYGLIVNQNGDLSFRKVFKYLLGLNNLIWIWKRPMYLYISWLGCRWAKLGFPPPQLVSHLRSLVEQILLRGSHQHGTHLYMIQSLRVWSVFDACLFVLLCICQFHNHQARVARNFFPDSIALALNAHRLWELSLEKLQRTGVLTLNTQKWSKVWVLSL